MKKIVLITISLLLFSVILYSQKNSNKKSVENLLGFNIDSLPKNFIIPYAEKEQGRFAIKSSKHLELLYGGTQPGYGIYTSHANFSIGGKIYTQSWVLSDLDRTTILVNKPTRVNEFTDTTKIRYEYNDMNGVKVVQELIPKENLLNKTGAVLIKYIFTNNNNYAIKVGASLLLDTKIGGYNVDNGNDQAPISSASGFVKTCSYIKPVPDFWLAFENPLDANALIGRGTLVGRELVKPDYLYVGYFGELSKYTYNKHPLSEGAPYTDSEIMMEWNEVLLQPGESTYFSTLYGLGETDTQGETLALQCKAPFDSISLDPTSNYEFQPFSYTVFLINRGLTIFNVKAKISYDKNVFTLVNGDSIQTLPVLNGGEYPALSWKFNTKNQFISKTDTIYVKVWGDATDTNFCYTPLYVPANRAKLSTGIVPRNTATLSIFPAPTADSVYLINQPLTIGVLPNSCYSFQNWSGDASGSYPTLNITMDRSKTIIANMKKDSFNLGVSPFPSYGGVVKYSGTNTVVPAINKHECGTVVSLTPTATAGYKFVNWSGDATGTSIPLLVTMDKAKNIIANFENDSFNLVININPANSGKTNPGSSRYRSGDNVTVTAIPNGCYVFTGWSGPDTTAITNNPITVKMWKSKTITANFRKDSFNLSVNLNPSTGGQVTINPQRSRFECGEQVTLSAAPNSCWSFKNWSGDTSTANNNITLIMNSNKSFTANFKKDSFNVLAVMVNQETGQLANDVGSITMVPSKTRFECGETVKVTALSSVYCYKFKYWKLTASSTITDSAITITVLKDTTLWAYYEKKQFKVDIKPDGQGTVSYNPERTNNTYKCGDIVSITALPINCWSFEKFQAYIPFDTSVKDNPLALPVYTDITGIAYFKIIKHSLSTSVHPFGSGKINGKVSDTTIYSCGDTVTLFAQPDPCYTFLKWNDGDTLTPKKITMNSAKNIMALFKIKRFSVTGSSDYKGGGVVSKSPDSLQYDCGRTVTVSIAPNKCFSFVKWTGDAKGANVSYPVYVDTNKSVLANMASINFQYTKAQQNLFPNIVLDFRVDSVWYNGSAFRINNIIKSMINVDDISSRGINRLKNFGFYPQTDTTYKIIYSLSGCYNEVSDTGRSAKIYFSRLNCSDERTQDYSIPLGSGCDSCQKILRRKDTSKVYLSKLFVNHPNPFNPETRIRYSISRPDMTSLIIYDILGREVKVLIREYQEAGEYEVSFIPKGLPSGVYFYAIRSGSFMDLKKMLYVK
jgi:uncharacterized repeat protein (TIGR02543 family)